MEDRGFESTLKLVDRKAKDLPTLAADCHLAWHPIGERAGRTAKKKDATYHNIVADSSCQQGYAHGYTIGYLSKGNISDKKLATIMIDQCSATTTDNQTFNCTHAFGHTIARRHPKDIARAIGICETANYKSLPGGDIREAGGFNSVIVGGEHQCLYGLYMEVGIYDVSHGSTKLDNCATATSAESRKSCYAYLPSRVGAIKGGLAAAAKSCHDLAPKGDLRDSCIKTFSYGLLKEKDCSLLIAKSEENQCHGVFRNREANERGEPQKIDLSKVGPGPTDGPPTASTPPE